jgi:hypothetical protein
MRTRHTPEQVIVKLRQARPSNGAWDRAPPLPVQPKVIMAPLPAPGGRRQCTADD